jgi:hypothetical protein
MKKLIFSVILGLSIVSCKTTKNADCDAYGNSQINSQNEHSTRSYPQNEPIDLSKLSRFERALYNTWSEMGEEDKKFFESSLIGN